MYYFLLSTANDRALKYHKNRVEVLKTEEEKLALLCQQESKEISTLNEILESVEKLEALHERGDYENSFRSCVIHSRS